MTMASGSARRVLRSIATLAISVLAAAVVTIAVAATMGGVQGTADQLFAIAEKLDMSWPIVARIAGPFSRGASESEREVWRAMVRWHAVAGRRNRPIATAVNPIALWPVYQRESAGEVRAETLASWSPSNPEALEASGAVAHFISQNEHGAVINCQDLPRYARCVARSALQRHAREMDGWSVFSQENRGARQYVTLSRVGFNASRSVAVLYAEVACGPLCGGGTYFVLRREGDRWRIIAAHDAWVS
jgi:hypothetical protein